MAHCPYERLGDLADLFERIRTWTSIREPKPGIFYFKSRPFLHFHIKDDKRWADVRSDGDWESVDAPISMPKTGLAALSKKVERHYSTLTKQH